MADFTFAAFSGQTPDPTDMINSALMHLGSDLFTSGADIDAGATLSSASDRQALVYKSFHKHVKKVLSSYPWKTISKTNILIPAGLTITDPQDFAYKYTLPTDFLRLIYLTSDWGYRWEAQGGEHESWRIVSNGLLTNISGVSLHYVYYPAIKDTFLLADWQSFLSVWTPQLWDTVELYLAYAWCYPLRRDSSRQSELYNLYNQAMIAAQAADKAAGDTIFAPLGPAVEVRRWGNAAYYS